VTRTYDLDVLPRVIELLREGPPPGGGRMDSDTAHWKPVSLYISSATNGEATMVSEHQGVDLRYDLKN
jgi:hypothetical protein